MPPAESSRSRTPLPAYAVTSTAGIDPARLTDGDKASRARAEASGRAGQIADGLVMIEEANARSQRTEECWPIAELLRVKGELLLLQGVLRRNFTTLIGTTVVTTGRRVGVRRSVIYRTAATNSPARPRLGRYAMVADHRRQPGDVERPRIEFPVLVSQRPALGHRRMHAQRRAAVSGAGRVALDQRHPDDECDPRRAPYRPGHRNHFRHPDSPQTRTTAQVDLVPGAHASGRFSRTSPMNIVFDGCVYENSPGAYGRAPRANDTLPLTRSNLGRRSLSARSGSAVPRCFRSTPKAAVIRQGIRFTRPGAWNRCRFRDKASACAPFPG
jgi:hypothetical protein